MLALSDQAWPCICDWDGDGDPDSAEHRAVSQKLAGDRSVANHPYPYEEDRPFFWRTGAALADLSGDVLTCVEWSVYPFYSHVAIEMNQRPKYLLLELKL